MKRLLVFFGVVFMTICSDVNAQEVPDISLDARFGYNQDFVGGPGRFKGSGLYLDINGSISPHFSYSLNHRIAAPDYGEGITGFDATNWLTLTYEVGNFAITAGKDALMVGSFEYDAYDLDTYYDMNSMFYNMFDCWQWGVYGTWYPTDSQSLILQFANSPFSGDHDMFSYNAAWRGEWDFYESYWSVNMWQYDKSKYVKALNLGNRFHLGGLTFDLEYMTRSANIGKMFKEDFTLIAAPSYEIGNWCRLLGKFGWEKAAEDLPYELAYEDYLGSDYLFYGAGAEFFPIKGSKDVRIHAVWSSNNFGDNFLNVGLTWKFDLTSAGKRLLNSLKK